MNEGAELIKVANAAAQYLKKFSEGNQKGVEHRMLEVKVKERVVEKIVVL